MALLAEKEGWLRRMLLSVTLASSILGGSYGLAKKTDVFDSSIQITVYDKDGKPSETEVPVYNMIKLPPGNCSGYVRRAAEELFGKKYSFSNAWDRRYNDEVVCEVDSGESLESLVEKDVLQPGMIIGLYNPTSPNNGRDDQAGEEIKYSHVGLFIGLNKDKLPVVIHQYGFSTRIENPNQLKESGLEPKEIIRPRPSYTKD